MSNGTGLRNIQALCAQNENRDAFRAVQNHEAAAQILGREIAEVVREHKEYLHLISVLRATMTISGSPNQTTAHIQEAKEGRDTTLREMDKKINEMHGRLAVVAVGINTLRG